MNDKALTHRPAFRLRICGLLCLVLVVGHASITAGQVGSSSEPLSVESAKPPVVTRFDAGFLVTVSPGMVRCRDLLREIARQAAFEVQNLDHVPNVEVFVDFAAVPVTEVVDRILGYAKVDFVLVGRGRSGLMAAAVSAGRPAGGAFRSVSAPPVDSGRTLLPRDSDNLPVPPPVHLPPIDSAPGTPDTPTMRPLDVRPEVIEIQAAPAWQPVEMTPTPVLIPSLKTPRAFPVTVLPSPGAAPKRPAGGR